MKILVVSDTHKKHDGLYTVIEKEMPDKIFHLGDSEGYEDEIESVAECPLEIVWGNCDFAGSLPEHVVMRVGSHVVMLTHGHNYQVYYGEERLMEAAREKGADVVMYGHTHVPCVFQEDGMLVINPGSISYPRQEGKQPSYVIIEVDSEGELHCELKYVKEWQ